jgi:hypothetical protein
MSAIRTPEVSSDKANNRRPLFERHAWIEENPDPLGSSPSPDGFFVIFARNDISTHTTQTHGIGSMTAG